MKKYGLWIMGTVMAATTLVLGLSGCLPESDNPLSAPGKHSSDPKLVGVWQGLPTAASKAAWCPEANDRFKVTERNGMLLVEKTSEQGAQPFLMFVTPVGRSRFLNLAGLKHGKSAPPYFFARYQVAGDTATLDLVGDNEVQRAIKTKKLRGTITTKRRPGLFAPVTETIVKMSDNGAAIVRFIENANQDSLYAFRCTMKRVN